MISPNVETFIGCDSSYRAADIVLYGAPFDSTTSYRPGARFGPSAIRHESFGLETYSPYQNADLTDFDIFDSGDLELCFGSSEAALADIEARAAEILHDGKLPLLLGGEHLVTLGAVRAVAEKYPGLHIIHFDAHADLRDDYLGTDNQNATYGRRSDWKNLYATAKEYFKKAIDNAGTAVFHETDPRSEDKNGRVYNNPYQYFFQQLHDADATYADESIYEEPFTQGSSGNDPRPYSLGRPSNGGSKVAYPCKNYGQGRINPAFYYGDFDPKDLRRDVACTVTGSTGKGIEALIPFTPGSKQSAGGISCNKFDENRQATVWTQAQRRSGINAPYMRLSEMYLGYAEACAATGDNAEAKTYLTKVRNRAFRTADEANVEGFINKEGSLLKAIIDERGFEFAGEGDRRFTLIRTGLLPEKIKAIKDLTRKMIDGLKTNGSYTFENGNTISAYIYTKSVDAAGMKDANGNTVYGYRLTTQCPEGKENDPVLYPSWRGQKDNWDDLGLNYGTKTPKTNLAIKGLFVPVSDQEAEELTKDGYKKVDWGKTLVDNDDEYYKYLFYDYDYVSAPIYLWPFTPNIIATGGFVNGYGFSNK